MNALPLIVPFFAAALVISNTVTCCLSRRAARDVAFLRERVGALEARPYPPQIPAATVVPVYNVPYGAAQYRPAQGSYYPMAVASAPPAPNSVNL